MGQAQVCDKDLLKPGSPCIIEVNRVNSPEGYWWGEVLEADNREMYLEVTAKITGGRVQFGEMGEPVRSDEHKDKIPSVNYKVYPDTDTTQMLFSRIIRAEANADRANDKVAHWRDVHTQTMEHLTRTLRISEEQSTKPSKD